MYYVLYLLPGFGAGDGNAALARITSGFQFRTSGEDGRVRGLGWRCFAGNSTQDGYSCLANNILGRVFRGSCPAMVGDTEPGEETALEEEIPDPCIPQHPWELWMLSRASWTEQRAPTQECL